MKKVYKHNLPNPGYWTKLYIPADAQLVRIVEQSHIIRAFVLHDTEAVPAERHFTLVQTGEEFPDHFVYHGMVAFEGFTWHVVEDTTPPETPEGRDYVRT